MKKGKMPTTKKTVTKKKRNATDATIRNTRAGKKRVGAVLRRLVKLEHLVTSIVAKLRAYGIS